MEILIPSGMLWSVMAIAKDRPSWVFSVVVKKVAIPSGILCIIIASMEMIPTLYNWLFSKLGNFLSKKMESNTPIESAIPLIMIDGKK